MPRSSSRVRCFMQMAATPQVEGRAAVMGGGLMGHGIAQVLALGGMDVVVHDPVPEALAAVPGRIAANLESLGIDADVRVGLEPDLEAAAAGADWVFEAAPESLKLKQ